MRFKNSFSVSVQFSTPEEVIAAIYDALNQEIGKFSDDFEFCVDVKVDYLAVAGEVDKR